MTEILTLSARLSIALLAIEWVVFGSLHFSLPQQTAQQLPHFVPDAWRLPTVVVTGMIEVATGVLIIVPPSRRWAAIVSLVLLVVYVVAVYQILADDNALADLSPATRLGFRLALVPNNVLLGICSAYLAFGQTTRPAITAPTALVRRPATPASGATLLTAALLLMANCAGFLAVRIELTSHWGAAYLWSMMCIASGALIGFLFAVPRVNQAVKAKTYLTANTNIESVSDWLTKIIVGVTLVNLTTIGDFVDRLANRLATELAVANAVALALIVYFFVAGLIQGFLLTYMFLSRQFSRVYQTEDPAGSTWS